MADGSPERLDAESVLDEIGGGRSVRTYAARGIVFAQGDPADTVFYLQRGKIKASLVSPRGKEAIIAIIEAGDFFGEGCLAGQTTRMMTATVLNPSSVVRIETAAMMAFLRSRPEFTERFTEHLLKRNFRIEEDLADQISNSSEKRLARVLLLLGNFGTESLPTSRIAKLSQQTLADMVGTTRSRISFFMNKFRKLGHIAYDAGSGRDVHVHRSLLDVILHD